MVQQVEAYQATDGQIFTDEAKAGDHQQGLQASAFLDIINKTMPERERNNLTANDWFRVQCHVVDKVDKKELIAVVEKFLETLEE